MSANDETEFVPRAGIVNMISGDHAKLEEKWHDELHHLRSEVTAVERKVTALVGEPTVPGSGLLPSFMQTVQDHIKRQEGWREDDVKWRTSTQEDIGEVRDIATQALEKTAAVEDHLRALTWLVVLSRGAKAVGHGVVIVGQSGKRIWTALLAIFTGSLFLWQLLHSMLPWLKTYVRW